MTVKPWEIWDVLFRFEEKPQQAKRRPAIVIEANGAFIYALMLTKEGPREGDYKLEKWREAGLSVVSYVRIYRKARIPLADVYEKRGDVYISDRIMIQHRIASAAKR